MFLSLCISQYVHLIHRRAYLLVQERVTEEEEGVLTSQKSHIFLWDYVGNPTADMAYLRQAREIN